MKIAVIGSRGFTDYELLSSIVSTFSPTAIISGGAKGADTLARLYAKNNGLPLIEFLPDWAKYGRGAGFIRNHDIINNSDLVIAFWDGVSKGTKHSIDLAKKQNVPLEIIRNVSL